MARPPVDVVVPFAGGTAELAAVRARAGRLSLREDDSVTLVDNSPAPACEIADPMVLRAAERHTPAYARNAGAAHGHAPWIVFLDADAVPEPDLLDRYFEPPPRDTTGLIGGGLNDEEVRPDAPIAARYAQLRRTMSQQRTFDFGDWGYPKSANIACRRSAFEDVGGFREDIRAAEDADLTYRLRAAGWEVERRERASAVHLSRRTLGELVRQQVLWGAGGAWLARTYPGSIPLARGRGLVRWALGKTLRGLAAPLRLRTRDALIYALVRPLEALAWELGRLRSNLRGPG